MIQALVKEAPKYRGTDKRVLLCFTSDPYQQVNDQNHITRQALQIFRENDIPFQVLTKGGMRAAMDFDLYGPHDAFSATLTYTDDRQSQAIEPRAALPASRMKALKKAHALGIETWVSLEPVMDPDQSIELIYLTNEYVDLYKIGTLNHTKTDTDWGEFGRRAIAMCESLGKQYYIKADLAKHLQGLSYTSTDTRTVTRQRQEVTRP